MPFLQHARRGGGVGGGGAFRINFQCGCRVVQSQYSRKSSLAHSVRARPDMDRNTIHHTLLALHCSLALAADGRTDGRGRV